MGMHQYEFEVLANLNSFLSSICKESDDTPLELN